MALSFNHRVTMLRRAVRNSLQLYTQQPKTARNAIQLRTASSSSAGKEKYEISESTAEYKYVERLIPPSRVPIPPKYDGPAPSGWTPPAVTPPALPYMIRRSRMHNVPVYTDITHGSRRTTLLRKVEGDIWALEKDVKEYLKEITGKVLPMQVNEVTMTIRVKGHFDEELKEWLVKKGF